MADFSGAWYHRVRSDDFRNRNTGDIVKKVKLKKRTGMRNKAVFWNGKNWVGIEKTYNHIYAFDPTRPTSAKKHFETMVRANKPSAKKRRSKHKRTI